MVCQALAHLIYLRRLTSRIRKHIISYYVSDFGLVIDIDFGVKGCFVYFMRDKGLSQPEILTSGISKL